MRNVIWFDTFSADERACLGGKSASLGDLMNAGLPVPPGFAVTTHAFRSARDGSGSLTRSASGSTVSTRAMSATSRLAPQRSAS